MKKKQVKIISVIIVIIILSVAVLVIAIGTNILEPDTDKDGILDKEDIFPNDFTQSVDRDGDGYGDNPNGNNPDAFPNDSNEWKDTDHDGVGDNFDAFPNNVYEQSDSDEDGVGNNADKFPYDSTQSVDRDGDGFGDNPTGSNPDLFPDDRNESKDSDSDGIGDNADIYDGGNGAIQIFISKFGCDNPGDEGNTLPDLQFNVFLTAWSEFGYGMQYEHYETSSMVFKDTINISKNVFNWVVDIPDDHTKQISVQIHVVDVDDLSSNDDIDTMELEGMQDANVVFYPRQSTSQTYIVDGRLDMGDDEFDGWMEFTVEVVPY